MLDAIQWTLPRSPRESSPLANGSLTALAPSWMLTVSRPQPLTALAPLGMCRSGPRSWGSPCSLTTPSSTSSSSSSTSYTSTGEAPAKLLALLVLRVCAAAPAPSCSCCRTALPRCFATCASSASQGATASLTSVAWVSFASSSGDSMACNSLSTRPLGPGQTLRRLVP